VLYTDTELETVDNRGYWEEILAIMLCLDCALCYILIQHKRQ